MNKLKLHILTLELQLILEELIFYQLNLQKKIKKYLILETKSVHKIMYIEDSIQKQASLMVGTIECCQKMCTGTHMETICCIPFTTATSGT